MRPARFVPLLAIAALCALSAVACSPKKVMQPNIAPRTQLFIQYDAADGLPHTVYHIAHLYWFGSDPDGFVQGYDIRFIWPSGDPNPPWTRTTNTDSLFVIPDTTGVSNPTFQVRAVDNDGAADPQPQQQSFSFSNLGPVVHFVDPPQLTETTYATQTVDWVGTDPDGDANLLTYRVWLDGNEANPHVLTTNELTFPTADFMQGGRLRSGARTAYVQAVDAGGRASNIASATWQVRAPVPDTLQRARLLLIDDVGSGEGGNANYDAYYNQAVARTGIPAGSWSVLQLEGARPFRSSKDLEQTLKLFDAVVWYRGPARYFTTRDTLLPLHVDGLEGYLNAGGNFYFESYDMIESGQDFGLLTTDFMRTYLGSDFLFRQKPFGAADSLVTWSISKAYADTVNGVPVDHPAILHSTVFQDSLKSNINSPEGLRVFGIRDTNDVVLWARDSTLTQRQRFSAAVAVRAPVGGTGRIVVTTVPIAPLGLYPGSTNRMIDKIFNYLGIKP